MSEGSMRRRRPSSPALAAPLPDDDDILREILLRLSPLPSSLPRASLVCKRWRRLISDRHFLRRFRAFHHRRRAPLLGYFIDGFGGPYFNPTLDPHDRIPFARLSRGLLCGERWCFLGCRHGLALLINRTRLEITVWDPVTGDERCVALPPGLNSDDQRFTVLGGALLCEDHAGRVPIEAFKVVLLRTDNVLLDADPHAFAFLYESKASVWSNVISTSITAALYLGKPGILVGNSVHWLLFGYRNNSGILEFDFDSKNLSAIDTPTDALFTSNSQILRMEHNNLGFATLSEFIMQVWERKANSKDGARWMLQKTIKLDSLLSLKPAEDRPWTFIHGYDEDGNVIFVSSDAQVFMIQLKSLQFKTTTNTDIITYFHPYTSVYTPGMSTGCGDVGAEALNNT